MALPRLCSTPLASSAKPAWNDWSTSCMRDSVTRSTMRSNSRASTPISSSRCRSSAVPSLPSPIATAWRVMSASGSRMTRLRTTTSRISTSTRGGEQAERGDLHRRLAAQRDLARHVHAQRDDAACHKDRRRAGRPASAHRSPRAVRRSTPASPAAWSAAPAPARRSRRPWPRSAGAPSAPCRAPAPLPLPSRIGEAASSRTPRLVLTRPLTECPPSRLACQGKFCGSAVSAARSSPSGCSLCSWMSRARITLSSRSTISRALTSSCRSATSVMLARTNSGLRSSTK